jgi:nucleoside-diphosphate-sugar epimerase
MAEKILVTGGSGFLGRELVKEFLSQGCEVVVFDVKPLDLHPFGPCPLSFIQGDIANLSQVLNAVKNERVDAIIHLAALLSVPSEKNPWASISVNALGAYHILEAARLFDVKKVLLTSSVGVYINPGNRVDMVTEETAQRPSQIYGVTKTFQELLAFYYNRKFGLDTRGIRLPILIGPNVESPGFGQFNSLLIESAILGKPFEINVPEDSAIPVLYVKDAVRSLAMLYRAPAERLVTRFYNIGQITPPPSTADIVNMVKRFFPEANLSFKPDPLATEVVRNTPREIRCDEAQKEWGWYAAYSLEDVMKEFIAAFNGDKKSHSEAPPATVVA